MKPFGYIYILINLQNNKVYIGQTINLKARMASHFRRKNVKTYIDRAINKYGEHNFRHQILGECFSREELNEAEITCIEFFQSNNSIYGYNLTKGGEGISGYKFSDISKQKISKARIGQKLSNETKKKISKTSKGKNNGMFGKTHNAEAILKIKEANKRTKETRSKKISIACKGRIPWNKGKKYKTGYKHSIEELQKMSNWQRGKKKKKRN